jgi:radical S-adenosyl methionine domain-containing protein 2
VINWHITEACNYRCRYCYAHWDDKDRDIIHDIPSTMQLLEKLWQHFNPDNVTNPLRRHMDWKGVRLNLAGGEPLLYPEHVSQILLAAKNIGFTTSLITNGSRLSPALAQELAPKLSVLGVSLDSGEATTNRLIGRKDGHGELLMIDQLEKVFDSARSCNPDLQIKLNTVVNALNCQEDLSAILLRLKPHRWKVLRMLPVVTSDLVVSDTDFQGFTDRHQQLGSIMSVEDNTEMTESYVMIDPLGRFFQNASGQSSYRYSRPILKVGVEKAFSEVGLDPIKFCERYPMYLEARAA